MTPSKTPEPVQSGPAADGEPAPVASDEDGADEGDAPRPVDRDPRARARVRLDGAPRGRVAPPHRWSRRSLVGGAVALVALGAAVTLLPTYLLSRARSRSAACFKQLIATARGDPERCRPPAFELGPARWVPWLEDEASELQASSRHRAAVLAYGLATAITPNATARKRAAERLLARGRAKGNTLVAQPDTLLGAFGELGAAAVTSRDERLRLLALGGARALADVDAVRALGAGPADQPLPAAVARGALLCLLGEAAAGRRALEQADRLRRRLAANGRGSERAELGLLACGEAATGRLRGSYRPAQAALDAARATAAGLDAAHALLDDPTPRLTGSQRLRLAAPVLAAEAPERVEALALFAPRKGPLAALDAEQLRTPWLLLGRSATEGAVLIDPAVAEKAAAHIEALAADTPSGALACEGPECPLPAALRMPERILREAARMLWFEAAVERARRGQASAGEATARALALSPLRRRHELAVMALLGGDGEQTLEALGPSRRALAELPQSTRARVLVLEALALAHLGRFEQAYHAAERAFTEALEAERRPLDADRPGYAPPAVRAAERDAAGWLWGAMALAAGQGGKVSEALAEVPAGKLAALGRWLALAARREEQRRAQRWSLGMPKPAVAVLPAVMFVAGRVLPEGASIEVWLDRLFDGEHRREPLRAMLARAEAARWRGDGEAEARWVARADRLRKLQTDYRTALLAHLAGLR